MQLDPHVKGRPHEPRWPHARSNCTNALKPAQEDLEAPDKACGLRYEVEEEHPAANRRRQHLGRKSTACPKKGARKVDALRYWFVALTATRGFASKGHSPIVSYSDAVSEPYTVMIKEPHAAVAVMAVLGSQRLPRAAVGANPPLRTAEPAVPHVHNHCIPGHPFASWGDPVGACLLLRLSVCWRSRRAAGPGTPVTRGALLFRPG